MRRELDFASQEIERLRAKLVIDDLEMGPLSDDLFVMTKERPETSVDNSDRNNNSDFISLKETI